MRQNITVGRQDFRNERGKKNCEKTGFVDQEVMGRKKRIGGYEVREYYDEKRGLLSKKTSVKIKKTRLFQWA